MQPMNEKTMAAMMAMLTPTPEEIAKKKNEQVVAAEIARLRATHDRLHGVNCCHPRPIILRNRTTNAPRVTWVRCEDYEKCLGCARWRVFRECANAALRFTPEDGCLWEMAVTEDRLQAVKRQINRMGGQFHRTREEDHSDTFYLVTNVPHLDATPISAAVAVSTVHLILSNYTLQSRPCATSHGWGLPHLEEGVEVFERLGMGSRYLTKLFLRQIADACDAALKLSRGINENARLDSSYDFLRDVWDDATRDYCVACLLTGDLIARDLWDMLHGQVGGGPTV